jgi:hypothetical protein
MWHCAQTLFNISFLDLTKTCLKIACEAQLAYTDKNKP